MTPDMLNGAFELLGGGFIWSNVWRLYRDRRVRGFDWRSVAFFWSWGMWNLFYYPHLGQWWSLAGGVFIALANMAWLGLLGWFYFRGKMDVLPGR